MGILIVLKKTKLYNTIGGCEATVFLRKWVDGFCSREHDGYEDSLFLRILLITSILLSYDLTVVTTQTP